MALLYAGSYYFKQASIKKNITSYTINDQCNLLDEECFQAYHDNYKNNPVKLSNDKSSLDIYTTINACHDIKIESVKKNDQEIILTLKEKGFSCSGGSDLNKISILFNESINLSGLEIIQKNKSYNNPLTDFFKFSKKEKIYPLN